MTPTQHEINKSTKRKRSVSDISHELDEVKRKFKRLNYIFDKMSNPTQERKDTVTDIRNKLYEQEWALNDELWEHIQDEFEV